MGQKKRAHRAGRKHDPDAKRHQTTAEGQGRGFLAPTAEATLKRIAIAGDSRVGVDFPLDVLQARGYIGAEMRDEGLRFAVLAWSLFGFPMQSCAALYERMVAEGFGDLALPRAEGEDPDRDDWMRRQRALYDRMARSLGWRGVGTPSGECYIAVREATQFCQLPRHVDDLINRRPSRTEAWSEMAALTAGLKALVRLRERHQRRTAPLSTAPAVAAIAREQRRDETRAAERGWFSGPLLLGEEALARLRKR
jgi:hypothetical protein